MLSYALTILVSAFLLFQVQPVIAKIILPWFGGSAAVWTTCLLFFQVVLLMGYLYAHALVRYLRPRMQAVVHGSLLVASALALPVYPNAAWKPEAPDNPIPRILGLLLVSVGLPYFTLAATGPLLQAWYARTKRGSVPYRLYALSNAGSMLALLTYPVLIEPVWSTHQQAAMWSATYGVFVVLCGWTAWRSGGNLVEEYSAGRTDGAAPDRKKYPMWLMLPACASALMLAVTSHLSQNVAAIPLLWVLPLSIYLLSFILCFERAGWYRRPVFIPLLAAALAAMAWASLDENASYEIPARIGIAIFVAGLFVCCMVLHGELALRKPEPQYLTHFYLTVSAGGALGGLFVGLAAPLLFRGSYELPVGLVAVATLTAIALRSRRDAPWHRSLLAPSRFLLAVAGLAAAGYLAFPLQHGLAAPARAMVGWLGWQASDGFDRWAVERGILPAAAIVLAALRADRKFRFARRGRRFAAYLLELGVLLLAGYAGFQTHYLTSGTRLMVRNFYSILRVHDSVPVTDWSATRSLTVGNINHGQQFLNPARRDLPTTYFGQNSGIGLAIRAKQQSGPIRVGVIGLGAGTLAAYGRPGDYYRYYEINPQVLQMSAGADPEFTFLADCRAAHDVVMGDGRLSLEREQPQRFDVLAIDAFSSDSVPVHLLTREAMQLYFRHLKPAGILAVNISNRFVDLEPLVDEEIRLLGKQDRVVETDDDQQQGLFAAMWMLVTGDRAFDRIVLDGSAEAWPRRQIRLWTDDYSNLFQILR